MRDNVLLYKGEHVGRHDSAQAQCALVACCVWCGVTYVGEGSTRLLPKPGDLSRGLARLTTDSDSQL